MDKNQLVNRFGYKDLARLLYLAVIDYKSSDDPETHAKELMDKLSAVLFHDKNREEFDKLELYPQFLKNKKYEKFFFKREVSPHLDKKNPLWDFFILNDLMKDNIKSIDTLRKEGMTSPKDMGPKKKELAAKKSASKSASPKSSASQSASKSASPKSSSVKSASVKSSASPIKSVSSPKSGSVKSAASPKSSSVKSGSVKSASSPKSASVKSSSVKSASSPSKKSSKFTPIIDVRESAKATSPLQEMMSSSSIKSLYSPDSGRNLARSATPVRTPYMKPSSIARRSLPLSSALNTSDI
jgi:hypothetical protein